tara:strand:- start:249 stop:593 length:345 start_codon:yes stop_codon:yes gene_type:complete
MKAEDQALLDVIEAEYRSNHMYWIERRLNKHFERWFRHKTTLEIDDLLAERQVSELQIEVFSYYNKMDYEPVTQLSPAAYEKWITTITMGWLARKSVSCWSKIKMASASNDKKE